MLEERELYLKYYPKAARKGLELGHIIASSHADVWYVTRERDGMTKVFHAHPESHGLLGASLPDWLAKSRGLAENEMSWLTGDRAGSGRAGTVDAQLDRGLIAMGADTRFGIEGRIVDVGPPGATLA